MSIVALPVQTQSFTLAGSGSSIGDIVINLKAFKDINGTNLTMASFGSIGYGTLEPGNGIQEEQVSFTGITQNSDGTAQLTGVKHVLFITPFTETSGMTVTHPGSTTFVISNTAGYENAIYTYLQTAVASGGVPATASVQGITLLSVDPFVLGTPIALGNNDTRTQYLSSIKNTGIPFALTAGTSSAYTVTLASSISTLASGTSINLLMSATNATGATLNINALGAKPIKKNYNVSLSSGDVIAGQITQLIYDGAAFQLQSPLYPLNLTVQTFTGSSTWTRPSGCRRIVVECVGSGGNGGTANSTVGGSGGAAGGYSRKSIDVTAVSSVAVTLATGIFTFTGYNSAAPGTAGGTNAGGGVGGIGSGGDINIRGGDGGPSYTGAGSNGGNSVLGGGGAGGLSTSGNNGGNYGAGAGGGGANGQIGGTGAGGICIVTEYY